MNKQTGAILLVAGTCLGSGMIALPMVLVHLGLVPSLILMLLTWALTYFTALIHLELNLQAGSGLSLGQLGFRFSGPVAGIIGSTSVHLLSYALLAVFLYGGSSIFHELLSSVLHQQHDFSVLVTQYAVGAFLLLLLPVKLIDYLNRVLFLGLLTIVSFLLLGLLNATEWSHLPLWTPSTTQSHTWTLAIPVLFTSFGFQVIFHTLMNYCQKNPATLKRAFFWGSLIPAIVYILWTGSVLSVIYHHNGSFYQNMINGHIEVGDLVRELSSIARWHSIQLLIWWISLLAILTSVLGVGLGLCDTWQSLLKKHLPHPLFNRLLSAFLTILPPYAAALWVPNAFIRVLGIAGLILVVIAILLPTYLLFRLTPQKRFYPILKRKGLLLLATLSGLLVIGCELYNLA